MNLFVERIKYITAVVIYGTIGMFLRYISLPSELVAMFRGIIGSLFIFVYLKATHQQIDLKAIISNLFWLVFSGICLGLNWIFFFFLYMHTTVAIASLCNYMAPLIVIVIAPFVMHEKLNKKKLPCVIIAFIGIVMVSGINGSMKTEIKGVILGILAAVCFVGIVICNRRIRDIAALDKSIVQLAVSALTILPYFLINNHGTVLSFDMKSILIIIMLGVLHTGIAYCFYFSGMASLPVQTIAILGYIEPAVSVLCSAFFLNEKMSATGWIGTFLIFAAAIASECMKDE